VREIEPFDEFFARKLLRIAVRPTETREVIQQRLRQITVVAVRASR
jgi:hypothetical protein